MTAMRFPYEMRWDVPVLVCTARRGPRVPRPYPPSGANTVQFRVPGTRPARRRTESAVRWAGSGRESPLEYGRDGRGTQCRTIYEQPSKVLIPFFFSTRTSVKHLQT